MKHDSVILWSFNIVFSVIFIPSPSIIAYLGSGDSLTVAKNQPKIVSRNYTSIDLALFSSDKKTIIASWYESKYTTCFMPNYSKLKFWQIYTMEGLHLFHFHCDWKCDKYSVNVGNKRKKRNFGIVCKSGFLLKGLAQAKIIKKSVILFWLLNMTIWCKHVHRLELQKFLNFCAAHSPVRLDIETKFLICIFWQPCQKLEIREFRPYI